MKKVLYLFFLSALTLTACKDDEIIVDLDADLESLLLDQSQGQGLSYFTLPESADYANIPQDPKNPITADKVALGQLLYHETGLAINPKSGVGMFSYSCASCHHAQGGFQAGRVQGIADGGVGFGQQGEGRQPNPLYSLDSLDVQPIRTPSALNIAYQEVVLWNGQFGATGPNVGTEANWTAGTPKETNTLGYHGVETQAIAGLKVHRMEIDSLSNFPGYKGMCDKAFSELPEEDRISRETAGLAIAAYERTLLANRSPFQKWLRGDYTAMSEQEKRGAILFFEKAECSSCHSGPALNSMEFYALGMNDLDGPGIYGNAPDDATQKGRGGFTGKAADDYKFKVPQLYSLRYSPFYGHGGNFNSIFDVLEYKNNAVAENSAVPSAQLAQTFRPLGLTDTELAELEAFITTGLDDSELDRYLPADLPSGLCFPNNDQQSRSDLGCE